MKTRIFLILVIAAAFSCLYGENTVMLSPEVSEEGYILTGTVHGQCSIIFGYTNSTCFHSIDVSRRELKLCATGNGLKTLIHSYAHQHTMPLHIILKVRKNSVDLYKDHILLFSAHAPRLKPGRYGYRGSVKQFRILPLVKPYCSDDFERQGNSPDWDTVQGTWNISSIPHPLLSVSPYQYSGQGNPGIAVTGNRLWDNYCISVSMLPGNRDAEAGLVFYYNSPDRFYTCTWHNNTIKLSYHCDGTIEVLFKQGLHIFPDSWHRISVCCAHSEISAYIDGVAVCSGITNRLSSGRGGVYVKSRDPVFFDDLKAVPTETVENQADFSMPTPDRPLIPPLFLRDKYMVSWTHAPRLKLSVSSFDSFDFTFFRQPVDWEFGQGNWGIYSRWSCKPQYTWFAGIPAQNGRANSLWLRRKIGGDYAVRIFFAVRMEEREMPFYDFPCNINCTFSSEPGKFEDDVTFSYGGPDIPTRIFKGAECAAENRSFIKPRLRDNYDALMNAFHTGWMEVEFRKHGNRYSVKSPRGSAVFCTLNSNTERPFFCLWSADTGISIARIQLSCEKSALLSKPELEAMSIKKPVPEQMVRSLFKDHIEVHKARNMLSEDPCREQTVSDREADSYFHKPVFLSSLIPQSPFMYDDALVYPGKNPGEYRIVNAHIGGTSEIILSSLRFLPSSYPEISFDYNLKSQLRLFMMVYLENGRVLRRPLDLKADGAWHTYSVNLAERLARVRSPLIKITIAHRSPYSMVQGDTYRLRNLFLVPSLPPSRKGASVKCENGSCITCTGSHLTYINNGVRTQHPVSFADLKKTEPASIKQLSPDLVLNGPAVTVRIPKQVAGCIDPATIIISVNKTAYTYSRSSIGFNPDTGTVSLDLQKEGYTVNGNKLSLSFTAYTFLGTCIQTSCTRKAPEDNQPPSIPSVYPVYSKHLLYETFSDRNPDFFAPLYPSNHRRGIVRYKDSKNPCIAFANTHDGSGHSAILTRKKYDYREYPLCIIRYRSMPGVKLAISAQKDNRFIKIYDHKSRYSNQWKTLVIDLQQYFRRRSGSGTVNYIFLETSGYYSERDAVLVDDVQIASPSSKKITLSIECQPDISGISGYSWVTDHSHSTVPQGTINLRTKTLTIKNRPCWFHIRACDGKGNWGRTKHLRIH